jgi:hypothetical protein
VESKSRKLETASMDRNVGLEVLSSRKTPGAHFTPKGSVNSLRNARNSRQPVNIGHESLHILIQMTHQFRIGVPFVPKIDLGNEVQNLPLSDLRSPPTPINLFA